MDLLPTKQSSGRAADFIVHGGFAAVNRGADFVKYLVPSLRARTNYLRWSVKELDQTLCTVLVSTAISPSTHVFCKIKIPTFGFEKNPWRLH